MAFNADLLKGTILLIKGAETLEYRRPSAPVNTFGKITETISAPASFVANNVQPLTGEDLLALEEGDRRRDGLVVFTRFDLLARDLVTRTGRAYEVQNVEKWGPYTRAVMVLRDVG